MKKRNLLLLTIAISMGYMAMAAPGNKEDDNTEELRGPAYSINNSESTLHWTGVKPGGKHVGTIEVISGVAYTTDEALSGGSFEIDMTSIKNEDLKNDGMRNKLLGHLMSEDFFYVEKYPKASFEIIGVKAITGSSHMITGELTLRGNKHEISFPADITIDEETIHARTGEITLDRTRWDVNHMSKSVFAKFKDNFVDDEMIVKLDVYFDRNAL